MTADNADDNFENGVEHAIDHENDPDIRKDVNTQPDTTEMDKLDSLWSREAKRMARNPCTYLWACLIISVVLSGIGLVVGEFEVSADSAGWQTRGTLIADRQTQLMMIEHHNDELFYDGDAVWDELINNVQPGWETDDDDTRRNLQQVSPSTPQSVIDFITPKADRIELPEKSHRQLPFIMTNDMKRRLQEAVNVNGCDVEFYTSGNLTAEARLWPVWKTKSKTATTLSPEVINDLCVSESKTQSRLEEKGLCFGCEEGCLPPYSMVLYARLTVPNGFTMNCEELAEAWGPYQAGVEEEWKTCVEDTKANYDPSAGLLPESCPDYFTPDLVHESFDLTLISSYTSSIFMTSEADVDALYDEVDNFNRGVGSIEGAYDTQAEDFLELYVDDSLTADMALALGSSLVVALAIIFHTRSPFLTLMGLLQIILSFPLSFFVYKLMAGLDYFPFLNFIGIFVVFALGAGNVFVAVDKWKNARLDHPSISTEHLAAMALPDAMFAMLLTTLTTAIAFFATAICPVAPIQMFSIFCGLLIVFDYLMNILLVFPALCIYDIAIQTKGAENVSCCMICSCFGQGGKDDDDDDEAKDEDLENTEKPADIQVSDQDTSQGEGQGENWEEEFQPNLIRRILYAYYGVLHKGRWPILAFCLTIWAVTFYYASTLELPTSSDVRVLEEDAHYEQAYLWRQKLLSNLLEKAAGSRASMIWGVKPDDTGTLSNPESWSQLVLDNSFDPSPEESQVFLRDFCEHTFEEDFAIPVETGYTCAIQHFDDWLQEQSTAEEPEEIYTTNCGGATGLPVAQENFDPCIIAWARSIDETTVLSRNNKVTVMMFPFNSRVRYDDKYEVMDDEWNLIENWMKKENKNAPAGVRRGYFSSHDFWWYDANGKMLNAAYSAVGIALACAAVIILIDSKSLVLMVFSTVTICYVLTSVTAILVGIGWTLGFLESICFAILIGVSVDFVIHFSHAYASVPGDAPRDERTKYALIKMGPSILATGMTTMLSSIIMFFTVIIFFNQFALVLFLSILQAIFGAFVFFLSMAECVGPTHPTYMYDLLVEKCKKEGDDESDGGLGTTGRTDNVELEA